MNYLKKLCHNLLHPSKQRIQQAINEIGILENPEISDTYNNKSQDTTIPASNYEDNIS